MAYCDFKDLNRGIFADKVLCDKAFNIAKDTKYDGYQPGPASMVYKLSDNSGVNAHADNEIKQNHQLSGELHEPIIRNFRKRTVYYGLKNNIWGADLADMQLISKFNKRFRILLCVIGIFSKYAWVVPLKGKKGISIVNAFQKILDKSGRKPNKIWVDKGSEFYNSSFKKWLKDNDIEMYSIHNEGKSVVAERFIRTLKTKIYKYMTSISKNMYIDKLDDIVNEYINTYHRAIKMKPVDVKDNTYIDSNKEVNDKDPKFKVVHHVRISKYKIFLLKDTIQICLKTFS